MLELNLNQGNRSTENPGDCLHVDLRFLLFNKKLSFDILECQR